MRPAPARAEYMTAEDSAYLGLHDVHSKDEAFDWWLRNRPAVDGTTLVVSHVDPAELVVPVSRTFGSSLQLLSVFGTPNLTILNDRIVEETQQRGHAQIGVDFNVAFDTNAASFLRDLFAQRGSAHVDGLRAFLEHFGGNRINWDIRPYLHENAHALLSRDRHIFETVLASERLAALDADRFARSGVLAATVPLSELYSRACREVADFSVNLAGGGRQFIDHHRQPFHAILLYMIKLQKAQPSRRDAVRKLKALIRFMDEELSALFMMMLWAGWCWFRGDRRLKLFDRFHARGRRAVAAAANVSWDIYHMTQQPLLLTTSRKGADLLVPAFLTADQKLKEFWQVYPIRTCWATGSLAYPHCVPAITVQEEIAMLFKDDPAFASQFFTVEAKAHRHRRLEARARRPTGDLVAELERDLLS